jgi:isocitrate dehydrogenase kinase/phosphatase
MPQRAAELLAQQWLSLRERFDDVTRRASARFEARDWHGMHSDAVERLGLYRQTTDAALAELRQSHGSQLTDRALWPPLKQAFSACIAGRADRLLAETFLNSITRRVFATVGVDPGIEFVDSDFDLAPAEAEAPLHETLLGPDAAGLVRRILGRFGLAAPWSALEADVQAVARVLEAAAGDERAPCCFEAQVLPQLFYRNQGAYVVGRVKGSGRWRPLILALLHRSDGLMVDAALVDEDDAARVFSFTRSYFQVEVERPVALVEFLHAIMPGKRVHELWTSLGFNKHGKSELYRHLLRHLRESSDSFRHAPGQRGLVMAVFTLASYDVAFKVIRDHIQRPKEIGREHVMAKYQLVFQHDRAGRLVDAQEFEHLAFERRRFDPALLAELVETAPSGVLLRGDRVDIRHLYTERRLTPLDVYLREAEPAAAEHAVLDYGQCLRDLAGTNIFPGDLLLKNFGVTRQQRVVFYDYDELTLLHDCRFRELPQPRDDDEERAGEAWFYVGEKDIFPEEFLPFIGLATRLREVFLDAHGELLKPRFWWDLQERLRAGELQAIFPYDASRRLPHRRRP